MNEAVRGSGGGPGCSRQLDDEAAQEAVQRIVDWILRCDENVAGSIGHGEVEEMWVMGAMWAGDGGNVVVQAGWQGSPPLGINHVHS